MLQRQPGMAVRLIAAATAAFTILVNALFWCRWRGAQGSQLQAVNGRSKRYKVDVRGVCVQPSLALCISCRGTISELLSCACQHRRTLPDQLLLSRRPCSRTSRSQLEHQEWGGRMHWPQEHNLLSSPAGERSGPRPALRRCTRS